MPITNIYEKLKSVLVGVLIVLGVLAIPVIRQWGDPFAGVKTINVSAEGKTTVSPDIANISFSVVSEGTAEFAQFDGSKKMEAAINGIKNLDIDLKDIKTTNYTLYPKYVYDEKSRQSYINGYTFTQTTNVKVRDLSKVAKILAGFTRDVNQINSVSFDVEDPERYLAEARNDAFDKALAKAGQMALKNGVKIGKVINFSEYQGGGPIPYYANFEGGKGGNIDGAPPQLPTIEPGTQEVRVQVTVTYEIK